MKEIQKSSLSPKESRLKSSLQNVLYRDSIARFIANIAPLKSRLREVLKVRLSSSYRLGGRRVSRFVYARA